MPQKIWTSLFQGHVIEVRNTWVSGELLSVDGRILYSGRGATDIGGSFVHEGKEHQVTARLVPGLLAVRCDIRVDGERIGGDLEAILGPAGISGAATPAAFAVQDRPSSPTHAACPACGGWSAEPVGFTWWGGMIGAPLLHHVRCARCGKRFNGKSGRSNDLAIAIYVGVCGVLGLLVAWFLMR